eukprot:TRINITY_DN576_c0_g1_i8.p2 TRINITY_DN576_c0_g1~~TRINITY_DN576_c0_g1_i8.p2  ORF type:complete len:309 (+),score=48.47 TRINITY_DN576_c0_g1_i8:121-1047(+)
MIRRPPRSTHCISSAASDVYKRQYQRRVHGIKNPHWIYPGDVVMLDTSSGTPRLKLGKAVGGQSGKVQPTVYSTPVQQVIPSIPPNAIEPFISKPLIIETSDEISAVSIVATQEDRMLVGTGDSFYAKGIPDSSIEKWNVFRKGKPLKDPETGETLAYEAFFLGNARLVKPGEPATLRVTLAKEEMNRGDNLMPAPPPEILTYAPHRPEQEISAKVLGIYGGVQEGGANSVVSISRGKNSGLEIGHVVALYRNRVSVSIDEDGRRTSTPVPEERYGLAFVFRVFDRVAYALVVESSKAVIIGDSALNP